jgi:autonomous glycyl radical cofactor GrcA
MIGRQVKNGAYEDALNNKLKIKESEMDKAEVTLAAKDMVDKIDAMIEDVGQIKSEELLPLVDKVRDEVGQSAADTLKSSVETAMGDLETALQSARSSLDNAARTVAGDPGATDDTIGDPMNDDPMPGDDMDMDDSLNSLDVPDAEAGGDDPEGREKRESVERTKYQIAESIYTKLAGKK